MSRKRIWLLAVRVVGAILIVIGLQFLGFQRAVDRLDEASQSQLAALRLEVIDNREANASLRALQDAWDASADDEMRRDFIALRDRVSERFLMDREAAMADFVNTINELEPHAESHEITVLRRHGERLSAIYANRSAVALAFVNRPPWYLQPTASFLGGEQRGRFRFNAALHALFVGELETALEELVQLRKQGGLEQNTARIDYALARLHLLRYSEEQAVDGLGQSLALVKESLRNAPNDEMSLLLLDYLLAIDSAVNLVDAETAEGQGSGQGDGNRGALADGSGEF